MFVGRIYFHQFSELKISMQITFLNPLFYFTFATFYLLLQICSALKNIKCPIRNDLSGHPVGISCHQQQKFNVRLFRKTVSPMDLTLLGE